MSNPIVFISHNAIRPGGLDGLRALSVEVFGQIEADRPGTAAFLGYLTADGTQVSFIHLFPDAEAFARHVEGSDERSRAAYAFIEPLTMEVYGEPNDSTGAMFESVAASGVSVTFHPARLGGFLRPSTGG
jgi:hypothetical protein